MSSYDSAGYGILFNFLGATQQNNDDTTTCAGCTYWDGDDGRCRNGNSPEYMRETENGCEVGVWEDT